MCCLIETAEKSIRRSKKSYGGIASYPSPSYEIYHNNAELYDADYLYGDILNQPINPYHQCNL